MIKAGILTGNIGTNRAGVANYVHNLILNMNSMVDITTIRHQKGSEYPGIHTLSPYYPGIPFNTIAWSNAVAFQSSKFKKFDLVHNPSHFPLPFPCHKNYLMTIHDITAVTMPALHTRYRVFYSKFFLKRNIEKSAHIISDSFCTKQDWIEKFEIDEDKITVIHLATDESFYPRSKFEISTVREKYSLNKPFILFVGTIEPRKNIPSLLSAFFEFRKRYPEYELIIVGRNGWKYESTYLTVKKLQLEQSVRFLSYLPHEDLPALYGASELFVLPSWYEGFGLPPLEAMHCGTPVIVSDRGSLPEIVGPGGCMVSPDDHHELAEKMEVFLLDENKRNIQIKYNLERAKLFTWEKTAFETKKVYQSVVE